MQRSYNTLAGGMSNGLEGNHPDSLTTPVAYSDYADGRDIPVYARIKAPEVMGNNTAHSSGRTCPPGFSPSGSSNLAHFRNTWTSLPQSEHLFSYSLNRRDSE